MRRLTVILIILTALVRINAGNLESAEQAYNDGNYKEAINLFEKEKAEKGSSSSLFYDLGNCYMKIGDYGNAMLNYEKSLLLDPTDKDCKNNIRYLQSKIEDTNKSLTGGKNISVQPEDKSFFTSLKEYICYSRLSDTWAIWAIACFLMGCICAASYFFSENVGIRKIGFFGGGAFYLLSIFTLIFSLMSASARGKIEKGIISGYKVVLLKSPDKDSAETGAPLSLGTKLQILDVEKEEGDSIIWYRVRLNGDYNGWISSSDFAPIIID